MATDLWLGRAILEIEQPCHPFGLAYAGAEDDGLDMSIFTTVTPSYADVLEACLHVILQEEWEHHRFAVRDLDAIEATTHREAIS